MTNIQTTTLYRVERQEIRTRHPHNGEWCMDSSTTFMSYPEDMLDTVMNLAKNPTGDLAHQPRRVVKTVSTETVFYTSD